MKKKDPGAPDRLDAIATEWAVIHDPAQFVRRYAPAVHSYLKAIIRLPSLPRRSTAIRWASTILPPW